ncbi:hypothetical protein ADUPG1_002955, partial [Aduncisulcus paluster]
MLETTENTPEEDTQDRVSAYFVQEVVALASMASTYETRLGKRHSSNSSVEETEKTFTPPTIPTSYTTSIPQPSQNPQGQNPVTYRLPGTATPAFASEGGFEKTQRRRPYPTCIFCQYSNHWCWECDHMGGRRLPRGAGQKKVTPEAWQRYGQIIADKRPDLRAKFDEFARSSIEKYGFDVDGTCLGDRKYVGGEGHTRGRYIPRERIMKKDKPCWNCKELGHFTRECTKPMQTADIIQANRNLYFTDRKAFFASKPSGRYPKELKKTEEGNPQT